MRRLLIVSKKRQVFEVEFPSRGISASSDSLYEELADSTSAFFKAVITLRRYFRQMDFERIGRTCYYGMSMARQTPTLSELLKPSR